MDARSTDGSCASMSRHAFGLLLIISVVVMWVASSAITQYTFKNLSYNSPYFLTYISTALFIIYLPFLWARNVVRACIVGSASVEPYSQLSTDLDASSSSASSSHSSTRRVTVASIAPRFTIEDEEADSSANDSAFDSRLHSPALAGAEEAHETGSARPSPAPFTLVETAKLSLIFSGIWFVQNYTFNLSLAYTSVSTNTILSSTSSLFTMIWGLTCLGQSFRLLDFFAVVATVGGVMLVSLKDWGSGNSDSAAGDVLGLMSACCYGVYTTLLKRWVDDDSRIDMLLFLGLLGVFNTLLAWPGIIVLDRLKLEPFDWPSWSVLGFLVLNGILSVLSDYLWARSILITSPLVATIGLSLTVPLAMVFDFLFNGVQFTWFYLGGSVLVLLGFAFVNVSFTSPAAGDEAHDRASTSGTAAPSDSAPLSALSSVAAEADYADTAGGLALDSDDMEGSDRLAPDAESVRTRRSERYSVSYANVSVNDGDEFEEL